MSLSFFRFMANLEQSGSRILDNWFVKLTFSLTVIFSLTKTEKKNLLHSSPITLPLPKTVDFLQKNADISKIKRASVLKGIYSETKYVHVLTYHISSF